MSENPAVAAWAFVSSRGSTTYETVLYADGTVSCSCPGWVYLRPNKAHRECKHSRWVDGYVVAMKHQGRTAESFGGKTLSGAAPTGRKAAQTFTVPSPRGTTEYHVTVFADGGLECDCPGFIGSPEKVKTCTHTRILRKASDAGIPWTAPSQVDGVWQVPEGGSQATKDAIAAAKAPLAFAEGAQVEIDAPGAGKPGGKMKPMKRMPAPGAGRRRFLKKD